MRKSLLAFAALACWTCPDARAQVVVIANSAVTAETVSKQDLRDLFTGASSSLPGSTHAVPVLLRAGPVNDDFLNRYVGKSDSAFRASWRSLLFSGQGAMPKTMDSDAAVLDYVARTPGAIGYVGKGTLHDSAKTEGVKILAVK